MKSAIVLSAAADLCEQAAAALAEAGAESGPDGFAQLVDDRGRYFTWYGPAGPEFEYDLRDPPESVRGAGTPPDIHTASACYVECRWEDLFIDLVQRISRRVSESVWVLDSAGVLWLAEELDPNELRL
jgi:hypothetical protein